MNAEEFGKRFKAARDAKRLSQTALAEKMGCTGATLSQWESGETTSVKADLLQLACDILETTVPWLLFGRDEPKPLPSQQLSEVWDDLTTGQKNDLIAQATKTAEENRKVIEELKGKRK